MAGTRLRVEAEAACIATHLFILDVVDGGIQNVGKDDEGGDAEGYAKKQGVVCCCDTPSAAYSCTIFACNGEEIGDSLQPRNSFYCERSPLRYACTRHGAL